MDASHASGSLIPSSSPPTYQADCPWPGAHCAVFSSDADSSGGGQFFTAPPINIGAMSAAAGFSVCTWFRFDVAGSWSRVFDFGNGPDSANLLLTDYDGQGVLVVQRYLPCPDDHTFTFPAPISYGQWRHVCIVNQGTDWSFYDDGVLVGSDQRPCSYASDVLSSNYLGRGNWDGNRLLRGRIAEFRIYNRSLSASEAARLYGHVGAKPPAV